MISRIQQSSWLYDIDLQCLELHCSEPGNQKTFYSAYIVFVCEHLDIQHNLKSQKDILGQDESDRLQTYFFPECYSFSLRRNLIDSCKLPGSTYNPQLCQLSTKRMNMLLRLIFAIYQYFCFLALSFIYELLPQSFFFIHTQLILINNQNSWGSVAMQKSSYLLMFFAIAIMIGYTYCVDIPQALEVPLRTPPYNFTSANFNLMYFFTFLAVGVLVVPIGIIVDRMPIKATILSLLMASLLAQVGIALLFEFRPNAYIAMVMIMRSVFGIAGEGLYTAQCLIVSLFAKQDYEFVMGLAISAPFIFDAFNSVITPWIYSHTNNLPLTWQIGCIICLVSLLFGLLMNKLIIKQQNHSRQQQMNYQNQRSCMRQLKQLSSDFWVLIAAIFSFESSLGPVNDNLNELIVSRFNISYTNTGKLLLIPFMALPFLSAIFGDWLKHRPSIRRTTILTSSIVYLLSHFSVYMLPNTSQPGWPHYLALVAFLLIFSVNLSIYYVSLTSSITFMVQPGVLGTAWGIAGSAIGFSQCLVPLAYIYIIDSQSTISQSYRYLSLFTTALAAIPVLFALWIYCRDYRFLDMKLSHWQEVKQEQVQQQGNQGTQRSITDSLMGESLISNSEQL